MALAWLRDLLDGVVTDRACVTCGDQVGAERWSLGYRYCKKNACCRANHRPQIIMEIGQTKTNAEYTIVTEKTLQDLREGKYRRDPIVVTRQPSRGKKVTMRAKKAKPAEVNRYRVQFVQACAFQHLKPQEVLERGQYMKPPLTQQELVKYWPRKR